MGLELRLCLHRKYSTLISARRWLASLAGMETASLRFQLNYFSISLKILSRRRQDTKFLFSYKKVDKYFAGSLQLKTYFVSTDFRISQLW